MIMHIKWRYLRMKYKILVNGGNSALLRDFFVSSSGFKCMSTSGYWADISEHYEMFKPDAYVCIAEYTDPQVMTHIRRLKSDEKYNGVPIVMVTGEDCYDFYSVENLGGLYINLLLSRPITMAVICEKINKLLNDIYDEKERIEKEKAEAERIAEEIKQQAAANVRRHIVVVDDDKNVLKLLKSALEEKYDVTAIANGRMALKLLETKSPDLIFLDYQMPLETGPEVFRKIRKIESAKDIPVVFLTGVADREKITEVLSLKPQGYLLKPINIERVNDTIKSLLG